MVAWHRNGEAVRCYCGARRSNPSTGAKAAGQSSGNALRRLDVGPGASFNSRPASIRPKPGLPDLPGRKPPEILDRWPRRAALRLVRASAGPFTMTLSSSPALPYQATWALWLYGAQVASALRHVKAFAHVAAPLQHSNVSLWLLRCGYSFTTSICLSITWPVNRSIATCTQ